MKGRSTIILLASIFILGVFIWIQETWRSSAPSKEQQRVQLFNLNADTLVSIQFKHTNTVVECLKENGIWMAGDAKEAAGRADRARVLRMISGLNSMGKGTTITAKHLAMRGISLAEYGFDKPSVEIRVIDNNGRRGWQIGRKTPLGDMVYVRQEEGEDIYTIPEIILEVLPSGADELRDRTIFFGELAGVRRAEVRGIDGFIQIIQDPKSGWLLQQPLSAPADGNEVDAYLRSLFELRVEEFVADNVSDFSIYGLQGETRQISLAGAEGSLRMLMLGDEMPDKPGYIFARRADDTSVFALKAEVLKLLEVTANQFRDAVVLGIPAKKVSYISMERSGELLELAMNERGLWEIMKPVSWPADAYAVDTFLRTWNEAVITEFDVKNAEEPEWVLRFGSSDSVQTNQISVLPSRGKKDGLLVQRNNDPTVYQINIPSFPEKTADPLTYKNKIIWHLDQLEIRSLSIERNGNVREAIERAADGEFVPSNTNALLEVDMESLGRLLDHLEVVTTAEYVTHNPGDLSIFGLSEPSLVLQIGFSGTSQLGQVLLVGWEMENGYFAMVKGRDVVFLLDKKIVQAASDRLLRNPATASTFNE